ncbi:tyrosine-type recombinase/integrase [Sunxiuqinia elliptica]
MARRKILISLPTLNDKKGDARKEWYVEYGVRNPKTDKLERFRIYEGLSKVAPVVRYKRAEKIISEYTEKLKSGWSPLIEDERYIYQDTLVYTEVAKAFGNSRLSNKNARFYSNEFLKVISPNVNEEGTLPTYKGKLRLFCNWLDNEDIGENDVSSITNEIILKFFDYLIYKRDFSSITLQKYRQILMALFEYLEKKKKVVVNPVYNIPKVKRDKDQAPRPIPEHDLKLFRETIKRDDPQLWLAIQFEYYCFLRPGKEIRLMQVGDIDFIRGVINVSRFRSKTNRPKYPTIPIVFLNELRDVYQLHEQPKHFYIFSKNQKPGVNPIGKNSLRFRFNKIRSQLNMPKEYKLYSWKHTGNVRADDCPDITMREMQDQNGHVSIVTTEKYLANKGGRVSPAIRDHFPPIDS